MGNAVARLRARLSEVQAELAREALGHPTGTDLYTYGKVCGQFQALAQALQIIEEIEADERRKESDLHEAEPTFS